MLRTSERYTDPRVRWARQPASPPPKKPKVSKGHNPHSGRPAQRSRCRARRERGIKGAEGAQRRGPAIPSPHKKGGVSRLGLTQRPGCLPGEADRQRMRHQADKLPEDDTSQTLRMKRVTRGCTRSRLKTELPAMAFWTQDRAVEPQCCPGGSAP